eukprot:TRINITY_DN15316_c0_g1_i1.p1 TRINITY_DN15316_c0_g1~~TRINITY_DN15316_c0_g1_i1.p1  ORF type:complete len:361 (-),score=118.43 TRINITY_DN15316_c0_g1_i1:28-1110(-)
MFSLFSFSRSSVCHIRFQYKLYANMHDSARNLVDHLEKNNGSFREFTEASRMDPQFRGLDLRSYLIMPVQRVPRYVMLLADFIKKTPESHPDYEGLQLALGKMKEVANEINEAIRSRENRDKILSIQERCTGGVQLVEPHRVFVKEGELGKFSRKKVQRKYFCLFNDKLIYGTVEIGDKINVSRQLDVSSMRVQDVEDSDITQNAFSIASSEKSFQVVADSASEKSEWLAAFNQVLGEQKKLRETMAFPGGMSEDVGEAPVWVMDDLVKVCQVCNKAKFTLVRRRHHCRSCGKVVCDNCSKNRVQLPNLNSEKPQRVCDNCFDVIANQNYNTTRDGPHSLSNSNTVLSNMDSDEDEGFQM